jgi:hypothetical protein
MSAAYRWMLLCTLVVLCSSVRAASAQPDAQPGPAVASRSAATLFSPDTSVAAASLSPRNLQMSEPVVSVAAVAGRSIIASNARSTMYPPSGLPGQPWVPKSVTWPQKN